MVNEKETSDKKRRKTSISTAEPVSKTKEDIYLTTINYEEQEALKRSPEKDAALFRSTCDELREIFSDISELKKANTEKAKQEIAEKRIDGSMLIVLLKKLNRLDKIRIRAGRDELHKEKLSVDSNKLQLQNLLYEADHLKKEVHRCYQFKSQDEDIELVSLEEFYEKAPSEISRPDQTKEDDHGRRLARLEWELHQRKQLSANCKELQGSIEKVVDDINLKNDRLKSLGPRLNDLLKSTRPLQEALDMEIENDWEILKLALLLPQPLYLFYANAQAYGEACDNRLKVTINGDEEEARQLEEENKLRFDEADDKDSDLEDNDNELERTKSHHRRQSKSVLAEQKRNNLFKDHPLSISITISSKVALNGSITLELSYLPALGILTVLPKLNNNFSSSDLASEQVIKPNLILDGLYPNDFGLVSPNPKTNFQLQDLNLDPSNFLQYLDDKSLGKPYKWAQNVCGIDFLESNWHQTEAMNDLCQKYVPTLIRKIRNRWIHRLSLYKQVQALEQRNLDLPSSSIIDATHRISSQLVKWHAISWDNYNSLETTEKFISNGLVTENHMIFEGVIKRNSAKMICHLAIGNNFPSDNPLWVLNLIWNGSHHSGNNAAIREMEFWVNAIDHSKQRETLLQTQLKKAMSSMDIYLETEGALVNSTDFTIEKPLLKAFRGRQRSRPFKVIQNGSVFTQIQ